MTSKIEVCKHKYILGYSFREPGLLFRNIKCDDCGELIKLSLPWRMLYYGTYLFIFFIALTIGTIFSNMLGINNNILDFIIEVIIIGAVLVIGYFPLGFILKYGKWKSVLDR